ncbi:hypothetical protein GF362_00590 [Candidatus Dojkabacteria bacterium]|nr:hypothetical protein [Candidatus Dojkabacteria bacterium]
MINLQKIQNEYQIELKIDKGLVFLFATWGVYFLIIWPKMLFYGNDGIYSGYFGVWSDWASHFAYMNRFLYHTPANWFNTHPLFYGKKFIYPFIPDFISAMLVKFGMDKVTSFILPSLLVSLLLLLIFYKFFKYIFKSSKLAILAITLFFSSGGLGFIWFINDLVSNWGNILQFFPPEYTRMPEEHIHWVTILPGQLLAQRGLLFGLPILTYIVFQLYKWSKQNFKNIKKYKITLLGFLSSLLLIIHTHSFIVLFMVCLCFLSMRFKQYKSWLVYGVTVVIFAFPIYLLLYHNQVSGSFFKWYPGWIAKTDQINFLYFWFLNWGLFLPFAIYSIVKNKLYKNPLVTSGLVVFSVSNLILYQPWDWDNTKILNWTYLMFCIPVVIELKNIWNLKNKFLQSFVILLIFLFSFSGMLDNFRLLKTNKLKAKAWSYEEVNLAQNFRRISNPTDIVLCSDYHHHWITSLTGRQVLMGYRGWLGSYGVDYHQTYEDIHNIYKGSEISKVLIQKYNIKYIVIGPHEKRDFEVNLDFFKKNYQVVLNNGNYVVYKV